jgi:hypothetical protein
MDINEAIEKLENQGYKVFTSEGFIPDKLMNSEVWTNRECIFKGKNAAELIEFARQVK